MAEWESDNSASPRAQIYSFSDGRKMDNNVGILSGPVYGRFDQDGRISILLFLLNSCCVRLA